MAEGRFYGFDAGQPGQCTLRRCRLSRLVSMAVDWPVLIQDSEDGVSGCYPLAVREGCAGAEADMRSSPRRETQVFLDDGCSTFDGHLFEPHLAPPTANYVGLARGPDVLHPLTLS